MTLDSHGWFCSLIYYLQRCILHEAWQSCTEEKQKTSLFVFYFFGSEQKTAFYSSCSSKQENNNYNTHSKRFSTWYYMIHTQPIYLPTHKMLDFWSCVEALNIQPIKNRYFHSKEEKKKGVKYTLFFLSSLKEILETKKEHK